MATEKVVLITGCSSGFGRVTAETLARNNCRVFAGIRDIQGRNASNAGEVQELAAKESLPLTPIELDVNNDASVDLSLIHI